MRVFLKQKVSKNSLSRHASRTSDTAPGDGVNHVIFQFIMDGNLDGLIEYFDDANNPNHDTIGVVINARATEDGKSPLDWASILGYEEMVEELIHRGADVASVNEKGFSKFFFLLNMILKGRVTM